MYLIKQKAIELAVVVAVVVTAIALGLAVTAIAFLCVGALTRAPILIFILASVICAVPIVCLLPVAGAICGIVAAVYALSLLLSTYWSFIGTAVICWLVANWGMKWSRRWSEARGRSAGRLVAMWQASVYWGSNILAYLSPTLLVVLACLWVLRQFQE